MNLQEKLNHYMNLPYNYHIQANKNSDGKIIFYTGYIEEFDITASGKTKKEVETNLTIKKRDYILNHLNTHQTIEYPDQLKNNTFDQAWEQNNKEQIKNNIKLQKNLTQNKAVGTINLQKLNLSQQDGEHKTDTLETHNPVTKMFNWLYNKFSDKGDKKDNE